jgi:exosortase
LNYISGRAVVVTLLLAVGLLWSYWPVFAEVSGKWIDSPQYSHAWLVPGFSLFLLWRSRATILEKANGPVWWGLVPLGVGVLFRLLGALYYATWMETLSFLIVLLGVALVLGGWGVLRHSWVAICFLIFMFPLPFRVETALSGPLQQVATIITTYILQTLGWPAFREGNVIIVNDHRIGVVEACNGLGMLILFFAMSAAAAILSRRPWPDRLVLLLSAIPIAIFSNVARIATTAIMYDVGGQRLGDMIFHDLAGWIMMPLALGLLWLEVQVMSFVLTDIPDEENLPSSLYSDPLNLGLGHPRV